MKIDWILDLPLPEPLMRKMQRAADQCPLEEGIHLPCAVSVRVCDDEAIRLVNAAQRGLNRATDVLSFPSVTWPAGKTAGACEALIRSEYDDDLDACFLGDILISLPHAEAQATEYGHSLAREATYLLVHGLCHLMGYDHIREEDKTVMRKMEEQILAAVDMDRDQIPSAAPDTNHIPAALTPDQELIARAKEAKHFSYSPYSHFRVGAALRSADGRIFTGCNIENAAYSPSICAERTALFKAVSEGVHDFESIAIVADEPAWPCGVCRQALSEFAPALRVLIEDKEGNIVESPLSELLPAAFGPDSFEH